MASVLLISGDVATPDPQAAMLLQVLKGSGYTLDGVAEWPGAEPHDARLGSAVGCVALVDDAWLLSAWRRRELSRSAWRIATFAYPLSDPTTWTFCEACPGLITLDHNPTVAFNQIRDRLAKRPVAGATGCFRVVMVLLGLLVLAVVLIFLWIVQHMDVGRMLH
jgi:hypothetical protein